MNPGDLVRWKLQPSGTISPWGRVTRNLAPGYVSVRIDLPGREVVAMESDLIPLSEAR